MYLIQSSVYYDIPSSTHLHKSQLLRGVRHPDRILTGEDLQYQHRNANSSSRKFGNGSNRYENDRPQYNRSQSDNYSRRPIDYSNPIAQHLDPNFQFRMPPVPPPQAGGQIPPPWMAAQMGWAPPPHLGAGRGAPQPPPPVGGGYPTMQGAHVQRTQYYANNSSTYGTYNQGNYGNRIGQDQNRGGRGRGGNSGYRDSRGYQR
jgi:5'-3' exoribonuclease 2